MPYLVPLISAGSPLARERSVRVGPLHSVDHENVYWRFPGFQFQSELTEHREQTRPQRVGQVFPFIWTLGILAEVADERRPSFRIHVEGSFESGSIHNRPVGPVFDKRCQL